MKITEPFSHEPTNPGNSGMRKRRMEALLTAWRRQPLWLPVDTQVQAILPEETVLDGEDWKIWSEIIQVADPLPPRTIVRGLEVHCRLRGLRVDDLIRNEAISVIGERVSARWGADGAAVGGLTWSILVPASDDLEVIDAREAVLRRRFSDVVRYGDVLLAAEPYGGYSDTLPLLLIGATDADQNSLVRLWMFATALDLGDSFLLLLVPEAQNSLADALRAELLEAANDLDVRTDARLILFTEGQGSDVPEYYLTPATLPTSRLADLIAAKKWLERAPREFADHYYEDLAASYALVANVSMLGETLKNLPPGCALFAAVAEICSRRPELIATFAWHFAFHAEGAFALLQLPQQKQLPQAHVLDLTEEWLEVQRLGRELLVLDDRVEDWRSILALGINDESEMLGRRHDRGPTPPLQRVPSAGPGPWTAALAMAGRAETMVNVLDSYLHERTKRGAAAFVFSLRLLGPLRAAGALRLASQLARSIVDGYAMALALDKAVLSIPEPLCAYGPLLEELSIALHEGSTADDRWATWLRPFDAAAYVEAARADDGTVVDSRSVNPAHDVPHILRAHAEALIAQAWAASNEPDGKRASEALDVAAELYVLDRKSGLNVEAFSWHALSRTLALHPVVDCDPVFARLGRILARIPSGAQRLKGLLDQKPGALVLAYLLLGLGGEGALSDTVRPVLRASINQLLADDDGVALGHALELANVSHQAGMARDAERLARRVLEIVEHLQPQARAPYSDAALAILAGALAEQKLWGELLAFAPEVHGRPQKQFIENMRALALMATGEFHDARQALERVLSVSPDNRTALANMVVLHLRAGEWVAAIEAADRARRLLPPDQLDGVLINEALAREQLGDKFTAKTLLEALPAEVRLQPGIREVLQPSDSLEHSGIAPSIEPPQDATQIPDAPPTNDALSAPPDPRDRVDVAIITALLVEYEAIRDRLTDWAPAPSHPQFTNLFGWTLGTVIKTDGSGELRVVVALAGDSGNLRTQYATTRTIDRWRPRYVLFSGIAGGLHKSAEDTLAHGDVVVSETIWHYEYQKIVDGKHAPRDRDTFGADPGLVNAARVFNSASKAWRDCGVRAPISKHVPKLVLGMIGSGEKVIDDLQLPFVQAIRAFEPNLQAVEMEAAGACMAIKFAHAEGKGVGFMMVRGISDMPKERVAFVRDAMRSIFRGGLRRIVRQPSTPGDTPGSGTATRDNWKPYASAIAAHFITSLISSGWWPPERLPSAPP